MSALAELDGAVGAPSAAGTDPRRCSGRSDAADKRASPRIGYVHPSGWGNLGDEAIQQSFIAAVRAIWPAARVRGFTLYPAATAARHGIEADAVTGVSHQYNAIMFSDLPRVIRALDALVERIQRPWRLHRALGRLGSAVRIVVLELRSIRRARLWLREASLVVAAGGGQLDALWGGAWGHPYALARWAWLCQRAGVPFIVVSVGFGQASDRMSRAFLAYAVRHAAYCSLRDEGSRMLTRALGVDAPLYVVPDLAFGLRKVEGEPPAEGPLTIGVSPMAFRHACWPEPEQTRYQGFVALWARLITDRLARGDRVHLFTTQPGDETAVEDVLARLDEGARAGCVRHQVGTVAGVLAVYTQVDVVVATRLHGVLLSLIAERPPVALAYERKVCAAMADAGLDDYCLELETATPSAVGAAIDALAARRVAVRDSIAARTARWHAEVEEQAALMTRLARGEADRC